MSAWDLSAVILIIISRTDLKKKKKSPQHPLHTKVLVCFHRSVPWTFFQHALRNEADRESGTAWNWPQGKLVHLRRGNFFIYLVYNYKAWTAWMQMILDTHLSGLLTAWVKRPVQRQVTLPPTSPALSGAIVWGSSWRPSESEKEKCAEGQRVNKWGGKNLERPLVLIQM